MVAELAGIGAFVLAAAAEILHLRRCRRVAPLAFGPSRRPRPWAVAAPFLRIAAAGLLAWGLATLLLLPPKVFRTKAVGDEDSRHLILVLDVSPSMKLKDAGQDRTATRAKRVAALMDSFFRRVVMEQMKLTVVAVYNGAMPVVIDTRDAEVVRNILDDLPLYQAFDVGKTDLFAGLREAARIARPWRLNSTSLVLLSDGDSVPPQGMPKMPPSVDEVLIVGVGDPRTGKFIDGHQSRQDAPMLRQVAVRLGGTYHDGNQKHIGSDAVRRLTKVEVEDPLKQLTRREYALAAVAAGAGLLALLPLALAFFGSGWRPGVRPSRVEVPGKRIRELISQE